MRVLVCGGRHVPFTKENYGKLEAAISKVTGWVSIHDDMDTWMPPRDLVIIHGGARGADAIADNWAVCNWVRFEEYKAEWDKYGRQAGYIRNKRMLDEGKPDVVIAFPGGRGTKMMVEIATKAGVPVLQIDQQEIIDHE